MSDPEITPAPATEPDSTPPPPPVEASTTKPGAAISFSIWPPKQRTRDAVINRLIETLSTPSVLSKRYSTLSPDDASAAARQIENEAFDSAAASASADDDGIENLQLYSKEISKRMLDTVKARAPAASSVDNSGASDGVAPPPAADGVAPPPAADGVAPPPATDCIAPPPAAEAVGPPPAADGVAPPPAADGVAAAVSDS